MFSISIRCRYDIYKISRYEYQNVSGAEAGAENGAERTRKLNERERSGNGAGAGVTEKL